MASLSSHPSPGAAVAGDGAPLLVVIDDDDLSREVLAMIAAEAGFTPQAFPSGEEALVWLRDLANPPLAVLTDMQMPGISGPELAVWLREVCGSKTTLVAMSGSRVADEAVVQFDHFLLKPFSADQLKAACTRVGTEPEPTPEPAPAGLLNEAVYANFARTMPPATVAGLYQMCLDDAGKRVAQMRKANAARDDDAYRRAAHAIKGGCGMVGALELASLAAAMETQGLPPLDGSVPDDAPLDQFLTASARLRRMLEHKGTSSPL